MSKIYVKTYGCTANQSSGEIIKGLLNKSGFQIVENEALADAVIINSCSVILPVENRIKNKLKELKKKFPQERIIISGCMPESEYEVIKAIVPKSNLVSTHHITQTGRVVKKSLEGERIELIGKSNENVLCKPKIRDNKLIAKVQIAKGCGSNCSYCSTKLAKGELFSYPKEKILKEIKLSLKSGCKEIQITSQDNSCYGFDRDTNLAELLKEIVRKSGKFKIRIGMLNPSNLKEEFLSELIEIWENNKIYNFLHLPVQSGSNRVLEKMKRGYRVEDFLNIVKQFRKVIPDINLWTDFIVGFPGETEGDFRKSMNLIKKIRPDKVNVTRFTPRPKTKAKEMEQIKTKIKKERSREMSKLVNNLSLEKNKKLEGKQVEVLITSKGRESNQWKGRNNNYKPVLIENKDELRGKFIKTKIEEGKCSYLLGKILNRNSEGFKEIY